MLIKTHIVLDSRPGIPGKVFVLEPASKTRLGPPGLALELASKTRCVVIWGFQGLLQNLSHLPSNLGPEMVQNGTKTYHLKHLGGLGPEMIANDTETKYVGMSRRPWARNYPK